MNEKIYKYFKEISKIPRETYHIENISNYLVEFAKKNNLEVEQDEVLNVIIKKEASNNYEKHPPIIIQAHMDMVCQKTKESNHNFSKDKIEIIEDNGYLKANNTTLGADNGIGIAMILTILESDFKHPRIEAVFTVNEEVGMEGATNLDFNKLASKRLINIDSEDEGVLTAGCAGGVRVEVTYKGELITKKGYLYTLNISNLLGGHSGTDIDKNRINAISYLSKIFTKLDNYNLVSINGGTVDNAICNEVEVKLLFENKKNLTNLVDEIKNDLKNENGVVELKVEEQELRVFNNSSTKDIVNYITNSKNGVISYEENLNGMVQTSLNFGIITTNNNLVIMKHSIRSSSDIKREEVVNNIRENASNIKAGLVEKNPYSGWKYNANSPLRTICEKVYQEMYNKKLIIDVVHAGLECGIFVGKDEYLDCVSIGPTIIGAHTPEEKVEIESVNRTFNYLIRILENL